MADKKKELFEEDIAALADDEIVRENDVIKFISLQLVCGSKGPQKADIVLEVDLSSDEIEKRLKNLTPHETKYKRGAIAKYAKLVKSAAIGAVCY